MAKQEVKQLNLCLRKARKDSGFLSYGQAGLATHRSPEVVGRHERGEIRMQSTDAIEYAEAYGHPEILMAYCEQCEIHDALYGKPDAWFDNIPLSALRLSNRLKSAKEHADRLMSILDDGKIAPVEAGELRETIDYLLSIGAASRALYRQCLTDGIVGIKKDRPAGTGTVGVQKLLR